jgi:hypothetical protein
MLPSEIMSKEMETSKGLLQVYNCDPSHSPSWISSHRPSLIRRRVGGLDQMQAASKIYTVRTKQKAVIVTKCLEITEVVKYCTVVGVVGGKSVD